MPEPLIPDWLDGSTRNNGMDTKKIFRIIIKLYGKFNKRSILLPEVIAE
jgi:hypothetical protein